MHSGWRQRCVVVRPHRRGSNRHQLIIIILKFALHSLIIMEVVIQILERLMAGLHRALFEAECVLGGGVVECMRVPMSSISC